MNDGRERPQQKTVCEALREVRNPAVRDAIIAVTHEARSWRRRATAAYLILAAVSCGSAYLGWAASRDDARVLLTQSRDAAVRSCVSRVEGRVLVRDVLSRVLGASTPPNPTAAQRQRGEALVGRVRPLLDELVKEFPEAARVNTPAGDRPRRVYCERLIAGTIRGPQR